jgi:hypothetical protein
VEPVFAAGAVVPAPAPVAPDEPALLPELLAHPPTSIASPPASAIPIKRFMASSFSLGPLRETIRTVPPMNPKTASKYTEWKN